MADYFGHARRSARAVFENEINQKLFPNPPWPRRVFCFRHFHRVRQALTHNMKTETKTSRAMLVAAFAIIFVVWGSTYSAIHVVVETMPPFLSAAVRFLVAGAVMLALLAARGSTMPTRAQWRYCAINGALLLVGGNGLVMWAQRSVSSGFAALLVALVPAWFALLEWLRPGGARPQAKQVVGVVIGFVGVVLLVQARGGMASMNGQWLGAGAIILATICWAGGSLYSKHAQNSASPWVTSAAQMLCGGIGLLVMGLARGELFTTQWSAVSGRSMVALMYLIVFGSWIAFSAYVWLLQVSTPARVSTYAYVNPVIALFLGWALLREKLDGGMLGASAVILAGVATIALPPALIISSARRGAGYVLALPSRALNLLR